MVGADPKAFHAGHVVLALHQASRAACTALAAKFSAPARTLCATPSLVPVTLHTCEHGTPLNPVPRTPHTTPSHSQPAIQPSSRRSVAYGSDKAWPRCLPIGLHMSYVPTSHTVYYGTGPSTTTAASWPSPLPPIAQPTATPLASRPLPGMAPHPNTVRHTCRWTRASHCLRHVARGAKEVRGRSRG